MNPRAPEIVELQSERLTVEADLDAYGITGITKEKDNALLQVAIEIVGRTERARAFLRVFEALTNPTVGVMLVTRDGNKTKIAVYTTCSSEEAKIALERAGGDL